MTSFAADAFNAPSPVIRYTLEEAEDAARRLADGGDWQVIAMDGRSNTGRVVGSSDGN